MSKYRVIQLTNNNIGAVAIDDFLPLGGITRRIQGKEDCCNTFHVTTSGADTVVINECGNYNITYNASVVAAAAGILSLSLVMNGVTLYTASVTAAAGSTVNITIPYQIRVRPNCASYEVNVPANIQVQLSGVAVTGGASNIIVERVY
ncbi:MAG: hypothetical protein J6W31_05965 [Clostridia bacterium]|nr:hypothetical protein [Clostridia bacterium]